MDREDLEWYAGIWDECVAKHRRNLEASSPWFYRAAYVRKSMRISMA